MSLYYITLCYFNLPSRCLTELSCMNIL